MESNLEINGPLLVQYVAGGCSASERKAVEEWMAEDPAHADRVAALRRVWKVTDGPIPPQDVEAAWGRLRKNMHAPGEAKGREPMPARPVRRRRPRRQADHSWRGVVAALVVATLVGVLAVSLLDVPSPAVPTAEQVIETGKGQRSIVRLSDGTVVTLNADSRLTLPAGGFAARVRKVMLEGEAYFEVASDTTRPFLVRTKEASVHVLGTAFNVQAYSDASAVEVAVAEGEVALEPERQDTTVVLRPHFVGVVSSDGLHAVRQEADLTAYLAWTEGTLVFDDAPFGEVVRRLERWYDIRIKVQVPSGHVGGLNARFEDASLEEVLRAVAAALKLEYDKGRRTVTFFRSIYPSTRTSAAIPAR